MDNVADRLTLQVEEGDNLARLDKFLAEQCTDLSRSRIKALILEGAVTVNDSPCRAPAHKIKTGQSITVAIPPPVDDTPRAENIPLDIVYEDDDLLVINKPAGLVVHPGAGNWESTLVNALLYHCGNSLSGIGGVRRPGIVHRLDKDTSGLMLAAKSDKAHAGLSAQLSDRTLSRCYRALAWGVPDLRCGTVDQPIGRHPTNRLKMAVTSHSGAREAVTHYEIKDTYGKAASLIECKLETGRTHQIRVHMAHIRHPLMGDPFYGAQPTAMAAALKKGGYSPEATDLIMNFPRQALHAFRISFIHPLSGEEMSFEAPPPDDFRTLQERLRVV